MKSGRGVLLMAVVSAVALLLPAIAAPVFKVDFSGETTGAEPKSLVPVVGIWRIETEAGKTVLAVDGRQWKEGQSCAGIADNKVEGYLDGKLYLQHALPEPVSGKIGLWSKADSYMHFDAFAATASE